MNPNEQKEATLARLTYEAIGAEREANDAFNRAREQHGMAIVRLRQAVANECAYLKIPLAERIF